MFFDVEITSVVFAFFLINGNTPINLNPINSIISATRKASLLLKQFNSLVYPGNNCLKLVPEDAFLSFTELADKYGYPAKTYEVITEDGYILTVFRVPGEKKALPILLFHGVASSADDWIIRGNTSLTITLAREGYDIWVGNVRGNKYSRGHVFLNPNTDEAYWDFTFNEHGVYDLRATIDLVLNETGAEKLNAFGHSQGTTIFFVLCSTIPIYNEKLNFVAAFAPVAYLHHSPPPVSTLINLSPILYSKAQTFKLHEVFGKTSFSIQTLRTVCLLPIIGYKVCALGIIFPFVGYDPLEYGPCFFRISIAHFPVSTSAKNLNHFGQVGLRKKFARYDYGEAGNIKAYNSTSPPEYELSKVTTKVMLLSGRNDPLSTLDDVAILKNQLRNVVSHLILPDPQSNHINFISGKNMPIYLYPYIFHLLQKYH